MISGERRARDSAAGSLRRGNEELSVGKLEVTCTIFFRPLSLFRRERSKEASHKGVYSLELYGLLFAELAGQKCRTRQFPSSPCFEFRATLLKPISQPPCR